MKSLFSLVLREKRGEYRWPRGAAGRVRSLLHAEVAQGLTQSVPNTRAVEDFQHALNGNRNRVLSGMFYS